MTPRAQLLSNGRYRVVLSQSGAGASLLEDLALNRWAPDPTRDADGVFLYLRDLDRGLVWSAGLQPVPTPPDAYRAVAAPGRATIVRRDGAIETRLDLCVDPDADAEIRLLTLTNHGRRARRLAVTSYVEVALNHPAADAGHPAFSKLFVQTERLAGGRALLARRRPRSPAEAPRYLGHTVVVTAGNGSARPELESDRARFLGRGRTLAAPAAIDPGRKLSGTAGNVLDPVLACRRTVVLAPGGSARLTAILAAGRERDRVRRLLGSAYAATAQDRFAAAEARDRALLARAGLVPPWSDRLPALAGALIYGSRPEELGAPLPSPSALVPSDLRRLGLSGKGPLWLARVAAPHDVEATLLLARAVTYWRSQRFPVDLLVLQEESLGHDLAALATSDELGTTVILRSEAVDPELRALAARAAWAVLEPRPEPSRTASAALEPSAALADGPAAHRPDGASAPPAAPGRAAGGRDQLRCFNGIGGFSADGTEYVVRLSWSAGALRRPPLPWCNVVANERIGFLASESGAGYTWSVNSRENRLTPWFNDPVCDPHGEALYLRDDETGASWSPTPGPAPGPGDYEVRHGFGYTTWRHAGPELDEETTAFVPRHDEVKLVRLRLTNHAARPRRLSVFGYLEWVLGVLRSESARFVTTAFDPASGAVLAMNPHHGEFARRVAFAALLVPGREEAPEYTADRAAFLGPLGDLARPAALVQGRTLDGRAGAGLDPCAAFRARLTLPPGERVTCCFAIGQVPSAEAARALLGRYRTEEAIEAARAGVVAFWRELLGRLQVHTPVPDLDLMVNGWLAYQTLSCRLWGRSAFYQSGGAYGFRDQLQDAAALVLLDPAVTRRQIVLHAEHQFRDGDVLHWWHPPLGKGIRTRFSDDLLWLPHITAEYVRCTGDETVLAERARFLTGPALAPGEDERFLVPEDAGESAEVYEHCCRALDRSLTRGPHGLPLMGTGDWNDGMNRVGRQGRGESVWLGFFLYHVLERFLPFCERRGDATRVARYRAYRQALGRALNDAGWDGRWYRRAFYDSGAVLGSRRNRECRIDAIAQAWAVLSGAAPPARAALALDALERHLVDEQAGIIRLLAPPFDRTPDDPGYIKGYLPGVRENGGQYTHGALWAVRALAEAGRAGRAAPLLAMLSPVRHARTAATVAVYQVEPYVVAADVYGVAPHLGRGGWTWYTGSAGWMFRVAVESVLGLTMSGGRTLALRPCLPPWWPGFTLRYRLPGEPTSYTIEVSRPRGGRPPTTEADLDGAPLEVRDGAVWIPLVRDGAEHRVRVMLGKDVGPVYRGRRS
ncbi:MAG TPA: hypothetical protein VNJ71_07395 [Gemmatimonadales bacterium]|nr:hypothetical protein [Gemmatimonadales bacterium]